MFFWGTRNKNKYLISRVTIACLFGSISLCFNYINETKHLLVYVSRRISTSQSLGGCEISIAKEPDPPITPVFAASYPGSGSKMTWNLIEALTGLWTGDEWYTNGRDMNVVSMKTHYPQSNGRLLPHASKIDRVLVLLRNPMDAIPSYHNFVYERDNDLAAHSTRSPVTAWIPWRNENFDNELKAWEKSIEFWLDHYDSKYRLVVSYESLVDHDKGPLVTSALARFLERTPGVDIGDEQRISCVWSKVVKYHEAENSTTCHSDLISRKMRNVSVKDDSGGSFIYQAADASTYNMTENISLSQNSSPSKFGKPKHIPDHVFALHPSDFNTPGSIAQSDPTCPQSLRVGPKHKPYSLEQHGKVLTVLRMLKSKYKSDDILVDILESYIQSALHSNSMDVAID